MKRSYLAALLLSGIIITGCGANESSSSTENSSATKNAATTVVQTEENTEQSAESTEHATAPQQEVGYEGMTAVAADELNDGTYDITVDSTSSMFKITSCELTVENGTMTAKMTMSGKGYDSMFMGTTEEAEKATENEQIPAVIENGVSCFTVPVEALDKEIICTSKSAKKQEWYDRKLVFRADSLPASAFKDSASHGIESIDIEDGEYKIDVTLEGGSGKASVQSPAALKVTDGKAIAEIVWSSSNYDYMIVDGEKYLPVNTEGNSVFEIPVTVFDKKMKVSADTTAMSTPHEIEYTLYFDTATLK
ncbi:MAG: hypothetical protein K6G20_09880 [Ruminococcus sp.]|nr:hypothetical protein [Ruminococcus sp.]